MVMQTPRWIYIHKREKMSNGSFHFTFFLLRINKFRAQVAGVFFREDFLVSHVSVFSSYFDRFYQRWTGWRCLLRSREMLSCERNRAWKVLSDYETEAPTTSSGSFCIQSRSGSKILNESSGPSWISLLQVSLDGRLGRQETNSIETNLLNP